MREQNGRPIWGGRHVCAYRDGDDYVAAPHTRVQLAMLLTA